MAPVLVSHSNMNIGGIVFPLEQQSRDQDQVVYQGQYDTEGVPHTKSGDRQPVQVSMEVSACPQQVGEESQPVQGPTDSLPVSCPVPEGGDV